MDASQAHLILVLLFILVLIHTHVLTAFSLLLKNTRRQKHKDEKLKMHANKL